MKDDSAHKSGWEIFEVVFGIPMLLSLVLHFTVPIPFARGTLRLVLLLVGVALILVGVVVIILTHREFTQYRQPTDPGQPTTRLIKTGMFSISRNPLYLGGAVVICGIALAFNLPWTLAALLLSLILCHYVLILPEERYLMAKFGDAYKEYANAVGRWLGRN